MMIFFAAVGSRRAKAAASMAGVRNLLIAYGQGDSVFKLNSDLLSDPGANVLVDSGAFSIWNRGGSIKLSDYMAFAHRLRQESTCGLRFVNLDVIPGEAGRRPTPEETRRAADTGWSNFMSMRAEGLPVLHVYHQHEHPSWLERLAAESDYIGISPANDVSVEERERWLDRVYSVIGTRVRTHGFGVTVTSLLSRYPFYSVDSTTWCVGAKYGNVLKFLEAERQVVQVQPSSVRKLMRELHKDLVPFSRSVDYRYQLGAASMLRMEGYVTRLWEARGVRWDAAFDGASELEGIFG